MALLYWNAYNPDYSFSLNDGDIIVTGLRISTSLPCDHTDAFVQDVKGGAKHPPWLLIGCNTCSKRYEFLLEEQKQDAPRSAYHVVRDDIEEALTSLGLRLVHADGTEPGKSCKGFLAGKLHEASKKWHTKREV